MQTNAVEPNSKMSTRSIIARLEIKNKIDILKSYIKDCLNKLNVLLKTKGADINDMSNFATKTKEIIVYLKELSDQNIYNDYNKLLSKIKNINKVNIESWSKLLATRSNDANELKDIKDALKKIYNVDAEFKQYLDKFNLTK